MCVGQRTMYVPDPNPAAFRDYAIGWLGHTRGLMGNRIRQIRPFVQIGDEGDGDGDTTPTVGRAYTA